MSITAGDLRRMIDGLPDDTPILETLCLGEYTDDPIDIRLTGAGRGSHGEPRIEVTVRYIDEEGEDEDDDGSPHEIDGPIGTCVRCGGSLYGDEASVGLCDECAFAED